MYRPSVNVIWTQFSLVHDYQNARTVCDKNICIKVEQQKKWVLLLNVKTTLINQSNAKTLHEHYLLHMEKSKKAVCCL